MAVRNSKSSREKRRDRQRQRRNVNKIKSAKLAVMMGIILVAFAGLGTRLYVIARDNENDYQKKILSQQRYDSTTLPFKRGTITDANGTILAVSEKVYNVVLDCKVMLDEEANLEPTLTALSECFDLDLSQLRQYVEENPGSQYHVLKKRLTYDEISPFIERKNTYNEEASKKGKKEKEELGQISGVWFESEYIRRYPNGTLACDAIGFTGTDNNGTFGLEEYYNDILNGTNGREYGYLNEDSTLARTTVAAVDGYSLVSTIDVNIQAICERHIKQFNAEHMNEAREGLGAFDIGVIVMDCNKGEVLAMATYPDFDLNDPKDLSSYYTEDQIAQMEADGTYYDALNALWRNFCISDTYEPGSTAKALTLAAGIESGRIIGNETYDCGGLLEVGGHKIHCNVTSGHGTLDVSGSLEQSCNVAFMKMGEAIGVKTLTKFQNIFNLGLKTNIDLAGETRTDALIYYEDNMGPSELATSSFGQGFNVTMIQMAAAFSSVVNGGYYYEPHMVSKIINSNGDTIRNIEPRVLKQTISSTTSQIMRQYLYAAVAEGTGRSARPAGYAIGGKTGTAEKVPRDHKHYVVSFIGFAPADDPQIVIYCVINEPNVAKQAHATYATGIVKNILTEVLPYLHVAKTEEMTIGEQEEIERLLGTVAPPPAEGEDGTIQGPSYVVDPETGELVDPETGEPAPIDQGIEGDDDTGGGEAGQPEDAAGNT